MSYVIGAVTLPNDLTQITPRFKKRSQEIPFYVMQPLMNNLGARMPVLALKGFMIAADITTIWSTYADTLRGYVVGKASFPVIMLDENPEVDWATWTNGVGNYTIARSDNTSRYVMGDDSLRCIITNAGGGNSQDVGIVRDYGAGGVDWSSQDFLSWCWYGSTSTDEWSCRVIDTAGNWSYANFFDTGVASWSRIVMRKGLFSAGAGTLDWADVRYVRFQVTPTGATRTNYIDRACMGVGQYVNFPGTRYDGIYLVTDAQFPEQGGVVTKIDFTLELMKSDDFYGVLADAV